MKEEHKIDYLIKHHPLSSRRQSETPPEEAMKSRIAPQPAAPQIAILRRPSDLSLPFAKPDLLT
jgi:hypothetical protein